jgi:hypothetical protein
MDVWIVFSLAAVIVLFAGEWLRNQFILRRARRELASLDHTTPFERTEP